jgi:uncharacterized protein YqkB
MKIKIKKIKIILKIYYIVDNITIKINNNYEIFIIRRAGQIQSKKVKQIIN